MKKTAKHHTPQSQPPAVQAGLKRWHLIVLGLLVATGTWAFLEFVVWNKLPAELVGKWVVTDGPQEGATFDFYRSGKMVGHVNNAGKLAIVHATVTVQDNKIYSTSRHPQTGQQSTVVQTIRTLTNNELVVEDQNGKRMRMSRAE